MSQENVDCCAGSESRFRLLGKAVYRRTLDRAAFPPLSCPLPMGRTRHDPSTTTLAASATDNRLLHPARIRGAHSPDFDAVLMRSDPEVEYPPNVI